MSDAKGEQEATAGKASGPAATMPLPTLDDVVAWQGYRVDEAEGHAVAKVDGVYVDAETGKPAWVLVKLGRFGRIVAISIRECAAAAGRVWTPHHRDVIREAPAVDPDQPLTADQERLLLDHYGIPPEVGRGAEIKARPGERVSARPHQA